MTEKVARAPEVILRVLNWLMALAALVFAGLGYASPSNWEEAIWGSLAGIFLLGWVAFGILRHLDDVAEYLDGFFSLFAENREKEKAEEPPPLPNRAAR